MRTAAALLLILALTPTAHAQWTIQTPTTADLRGIDNVGHGIAWASGTNGTVLRTEDGGYLWQRCTIPPNAEPLDFRAIQAFDANTAIVMSSGKGDLSRLYKTTDGCQTWKLVATNPDKDGFWDSVKAYNEAMPANDDKVLILGDSVDGKLRLWEWKDDSKEPELELSYQARGSAAPTEGSFAARTLFYKSPPPSRQTIRGNIAFVGHPEPQTTYTSRTYEMKVHPPANPAARKAGVSKYHSRPEALLREFSRSSSGQSFQALQSAAIL